MKTAIILSSVLLSGCVTLIPAAAPEFPVAPQVLLEKCPQLQKADPNKGTLRDLLYVVIENYSTYYQCAAKNQGWQDWYIEQRKIYKEITK